MKIPTQKLCWIVHFYLGYVRNYVSQKLLPSMAQGYNQPKVKLGQTGEMKSKKQPLCSKSCHSLNAARGRYRDTANSWFAPQLHCQCSFWISSFVDQKQSRLTTREHPENVEVIDAKGPQHLINSYTDSLHKINPDFSIICSPVPVHISDFYLIF